MTRLLLLLLLDRGSEGGVLRYHVVVLGNDGVAVAVSHDRLTDLVGIVAQHSRGRGLELYLLRWC